MSSSQHFSVGTIGAGTLGPPRHLQQQPRTSLDTTAAAKGWQLRGGRERCRNPQSSARPCKRICKPDTARRAEAGQTTGMAGDGPPTFAVVGSAA